MIPPRQMRRQARRIRRGGMQPMMLVTGNDQLPPSALVLIVHWAWRYRSELGPVVPALTILIAALWLHAKYPHWWPVIIGLTVLATGGLGTAGHRIGLPSRTECVYAAVVIAAIGAWLAAGTVFGPFTTPFPQILIIAGPILSVPWWAHRRRRARVRVERLLEAWPDIARAVGLVGSQVMSAVVDVWGWRARLRLARGQTITDVINKIPAIESGLGTFRGAVRVYPTPDDLANRCELRVLDTDPHADAIPWPGPSITSITQPVDLGPFEDAAPCRVFLLRRHTLGGGTTGVGKSGWLNVLMGNLVACEDVVVWAIDLKKGMELGPWQPCLGRPLATSPQQAIALLASAVAVLHARAEQLAAIGRRVWEPSPQMPALEIVIDEFAELTDEAPEAAKYTDAIARLGRAVAVTLVAATQRPTQKAMGQGAVRSQMDIRVCFRVRERKDVDLILGQGMLSAGWHAHTLNAPGKFLISAPEHQTPKRARGYLVTDEAVRDIVARYAERRPELDEVSHRAAEAANVGQVLALPVAPSDLGGPEPLTDDQADDGRPGGTQENADEAQRASEALLWAALSLAPDEGSSVPDLADASGMSRRWVYWRLAKLAAAGRVNQISKGRWSAVASSEGDNP